MKKLSECTIIGKIINTRGIKGEVKILPLTSDINRFKKLNNVLVGEKLQSLEISSVKVDNRFVYIKFKGYDNINDVLKFKNEDIYINDDDRIELDENYYFISDIIGCEVFNLENENLGKIVDVIENPANDIYVLSNANGESLIPAVSKFIKKIDIPNKSIIIEPIEGLIN